MLSATKQIKETNGSENKGNDTPIKRAASQEGYLNEHLKKNTKTTSSGYEKGTVEDRRTAIQTLTKSMLGVLRPGLLNHS